MNSGGKAQKTGTAARLKAREIKRAGPIDLLEAPTGADIAQTGSKRGWRACVNSEETRVAHRRTQVIKHTA
jgi:hypothetical protein